jgi:Domain of unknown function (DUF4189)
MKSLVRAAACAALIGLAPTAALADYFGAIAFNPYSSQWGSSYDYGSRYDAEQRALYECGGGCQIGVWFQNACGAIARGPGTRWGSGWAGSRGQAESIALNYCAQGGYSCYILAWSCTRR